MAENDAAGRRLQGNVLAPSRRRTTVRVRNGELLVSDGPFAETKEVIVGFDLLECADLDEAIEVARTHPMARSGRHRDPPAGRLRAVTDPARAAAGRRPPPTRTRGSSRR